VFIERVQQRAKPQSIAQQVIDAVREMILSGELAEGAQLRQDTLAGLLQVSRIPVREALRQLEAEGLVTFFPHRGAIVSALSSSEIRELFDTRALLECDLLCRAIPNMTEADFSRADAVLQAFDDAFARWEVRLWGQLNWRYHSALYTPANRPLTMGLVQNLSFNVDRYLRLHLQLATEIERARRDHRRLLALCRGRRTEAACKFLRKHIMGAGTALVRFLEAHRSAPGRAAAAPAAGRQVARHAAPRRAPAPAAIAGRRRRAPPLPP